ncbi:MAG: DUF371 domain-containing protein [Euryarchaeota archaeon]|nr:DUF371 domain-containing protein [Euryarchaeota archaeon]
MFEKVMVTARGHVNITARHRTTLEITKETWLTPRGDCIVGVGADLALADFPERFKRLARRDEAIITLKLRAGEECFVVRGRGSRSLSFSDRVSMVVRRSGYTCGRTLMVQASAAACDLPRSMVRLLRNPEQVLIAEVCVQLQK